MEDFDLAKYIYWQYSIAVLLVTEIARALTKGINDKIVRFIVVDNPKWLSLIVAVILAVCDWLIFSSGNKFHFWQFIISFSVAVLGYDYAVKLVKDQFKKAPDVVTTVTETKEIKIEEKLTPKDNPRT